MYLFVIIIRAIQETIFIILVERQLYIQLGYLFNFANVHVNIYICNIPFVDNGNYLVQKFFAVDETMYEKCFANAKDYTNDTCYFLVYL